MALQDTRRLPDEHIAVRDYLPIHCQSNDVVAAKVARRFYGDHVSPVPAKKAAKNSSPALHFSSFLPPHKNISLT